MVLWNLYLIRAILLFQITHFQTKYSMHHKPRFPTKKKLTKFEKHRVGKKRLSIILLLSIPSVVFKLVFSIEILTRFLNHLKIRNVLVSSPLISFDELDYWITLGGVKFLPLSTQSKNSDPAWQMLSCFYSKR